MSRRNFILLIIILTIVAVSVLVFLYFNQTPSQSNNNTEDSGIFSNLNPFKGITNISPSTTLPTDTNNGNTMPIGEIENRKLMKISTMPIAGFAVFQKEKTEKEFVPALRYVDRATGNIYQTFVDEIQERRFSNTIIPKVYEAFFGNNGEVVVMRYLKEDDQTIQTFLGNLPKEKLGEEITEEQEIEGYFLPDNISDLSLSTDTTKLFYLFNTSNSASGIILNLKDDKKIQVFNSRFTEWLSFWPNSKMITLNTKPSGRVSGYMYAINPTKKDINRIFGNINGLTTLTSPDGKLVLYNNSNLLLNVYQVDTKNSTTLGLNTLAEKCTWNKTSEFAYCAVPRLVNPGLYPDFWYRGEVSFSDEIWKINLENGLTSKIIDPANTIGGEDIDGIKLALDEDESYLFFVNKKDSHLWILNLE